MEPVWQMLPAPVGLPGYKRQDLGVAERLFIGAVVNLPPEQRPWGSITWLADVCQTSRPTVYAIGERARQCLAAQPSGRPARLPSQTKTDAARPLAPQIAVTANRRARTILTLLFPAGASEHSMDTCLRVAFDQGQSVGFISEFLRAAGRRAGHVLETVDHRGLGPVTLARDEIFTGSAPNLLLVEPHSLTIAGLYATSDCDTETWACALLLTQDRGVDLRSLAEDDCRTYAASCLAAGLNLPAQKDAWHLGHAAQQVVTDVEREALRALTEAERLEKKLRHRWDAAQFAAWATATEKAEQLLPISAQLRFWTDCVWDALEIVDWRSGEIRDRTINQWLLTETITALRALAHPRIQKLADRLEAQAPDLFTGLDLLAPDLARWQARLAAHGADPAWATAFQASVARAWRLEQAVKNGRRTFVQAAAAARQRVTDFIAADAVVQRLADELQTLLATTVRTSSAAEAINSVLRPYFTGRREGTDDSESRQLFLNLFTLWFNLHKFESGPRKGHSPYELAGIDLGTDDWLTLLGYPPD
jgi:hypothetical protein